MKPSQVLVAESSECSVLVSGMFDDQIRVIGASIPTSVRSGDDVHSFTLYLPDAMGVVALSVHTKRFGDKKYGSSVPLLLAVRFRQGEAWLDLDEQWISPKPAQVYHDRLEVQIGEERFSTRKPYSDGSERIRYVPDANLLCRYLVGAATADGVRAAAEEAVAEVSRKERIAQLEAQVKQLEAKAQEYLDAIHGRHEAAQSTIKQLERGIELLEAENRSLEKDLGVVAVARDEWRGHVERLRRLLSKRRFLRKDLRDALQEILKSKLADPPGAWRG